MQGDLGDAAFPPTKKNGSLKDTDFVDTLIMVSVYLPYLQPEISYCNRLMTGILEF